MTEQTTLEDNLDLMKAVQLLPEHLRGAVILWSLGYTQDEIARRSGVHQTTVMRRLENAFNLLKHA
jgi:DNA-directed RNA polymerase specialized sigma24 family protein